MKTFRLALAVLLLCAHAAAQRDERPLRPLRLTTQIVGRRECAGGRLHILQLTLRLRYQNVGDGKVIFYRGKNLFYQTRIKGGSSAAPYDVVVLNARFNDAQAEALNAPRPGAAFVTLAPGEAYETDITVGVGLAADAAGRGANSIAAGGHTLQVVASSWYESRKLADELRARWRASGLLWADPLASEPLAFDAARDEQARPCR